MAGVTKHPKSPYWTAIYYDGTPGGKFRKSTGLKDEAEARKMADELERLAKEAAQGALVEASARKAVSEIVERYTGEKLQFHTTKAWLDEWLAGKSGAVDAKTVGRYQQVNRDFTAFLGKKADRVIAAVTVKDVRSFRDALAKRGLSVSTVNQTIRKVLSAPFSAAQRLGYIQTNPCAGVEALRDDEDRGGREPFTIEQVRALLLAADEEWQGVILFGFHTSLRLRDVTNLEWSAIDMDAGVLSLTPRKTKRHGTKVVIPLHPEVMAWLGKRDRGIGKAKVFPTLAGRITGGPHGLSGRFIAIMEKAGIKGRILRQRQGDGRQTSSLSFHSLRHSFISAMANAGVSAELRKKLAGHTDDASHALYTHHEIETMRAAIAKMPSLSQA